MDFGKSESYGDKICKAIEIIVDKKLKKVERDKTIEGVIEEKTKDGQYRVRIKGALYTAAPMNPFLNFKVGDSVLVLIPKGDFSYKKIIIDLTNKETSCEMLLPNSISILDGKRVQWQKLVIGGQESYILVGEDILTREVQEPAASTGAIMLNGKRAEWKKVIIGGKESFILTGEDLPNF